MSVGRGRERGRDISLRSMSMQRGVEQLPMLGMRRMRKSTEETGGRGGFRRIWTRTRCWTRTRWRGWGVGLGLVG